MFERDLILITSGTLGLPGLNVFASIHGLLKRISKDPCKLYASFKRKIMVNGVFFKRLICIRNMKKVWSWELCHFLFYILLILQKQLKVRRHRIKH